MNNKNPFESDKQASNNLFDVFFKDRKQIKLKRIEAKQQLTKIDDNVFLNVLKKGSKENITKNEKEDTPKKVVNELEMVYKNVRVLSSIKLNLEPKKYYKFPFEIDTFVTRSNSTYNDKLHFYWINAMKSVYKNYMHYGTPFKIFFMDQLFLFEIYKSIRTVRIKNNAVCSLLNKNEILYNRNSKNEIIIEGIDINMVFDMIVNIEITNKIAYPFILAENEFENSIMYHTSCKSLPVIQSKGVLYYYYFMDGYFFGKDYENLFLHDLSFNIDNS